MRLPRSSCAILIPLVAWATAHAQCFTPNPEAFGTPQFDGAPGTINALLALDGSLYVGGQFSRAGGVNAENVARWDGTRWSSLGEGVPGLVRDLLIAPNPSGGTSLYASGRCSLGDGTSSPLSRWDGAQWRPDPRLMGDAIDAIVYPSTNGNLYLAGAFAIPGASAPFIPSTFVKLGATVDSVGVTGNVLRLASIRFNNAEHLVAAGAFNSVGTTVAPDIAKFNGTTWSAFPQIPGSLRLTQVEALGKLPLNPTATPTDQLWVSGFTTGTYTWTPNTSNGTWQIAPGTISSALAPSLLYTDTRLAAGSASPRMIAAGPNFSFNNAREVALFEGSFWSGLSPFATDSFVQSIYAIAAYSPTQTSSPPLIFAGTFDGLWQTPGPATFEPIQRFNSIARFDGTNVAPLASDANSGVTVPGVRGIAYNPTSHQILAVGEFTQRDGQALSGSLARWANAQWFASNSEVVGTPMRAVPYADGFAIAGNFTVRNNSSIAYVALVSADGSVVAAGAPAFTASSMLASGVISGVDRLFANSGSTVREWSQGFWSPLPALTGALRGISVAPDVVAGSDNTLYAFGNNLATGGRPLMRLVNGAWQVVGDASIGSNASISSILVAPTANGQRLYAFGQFLVNNRLASVAILQPDGSWSLLNFDRSPLVRQVGVVTIDGEPSIIGIGEFAIPSASSPTQYTYLARLGQDAWEPWGPSFNAPIRSMQIVDSPAGPRVLVAGDFTRVGESRVRGFATLVPCTPCIADVDASGGVDATDRAIFMDHYERGEDPADIDLSGGVDAGDLATFFTAFESGC